MDDKLINGLYCKKGRQNWISLEIGIDVKKFSEELIRLKDKVSDRGFINIDVCVSRDKQKLYTILNDFQSNNKEEVKSKDHSPDREDLPF